MNKMAIFVEGQTEQLFVEELVKQIAGKQNVMIEKRQARGGASAKRRITLLDATVPSETVARYFFLIVDCGTDSRVASDIREQFEKLVAAGHRAIVGIRDVYPEAREEIPRIRRAMLYGQKSIPFSPTIVLAVMEVETWFIAEHTHFAAIDPLLNSEFIHSSLGFNPESDNIELRPRPAIDLHNAYGLTGRAYQKHRAHVQRTVSCLDYARLYLELPARYPSLKSLVDALDSFLKLP